MPKVKTVVFVDRGVLDQYEGLAASAGSSRSSLMRHALVQALPEVRAALERFPGRFAITASQPARTKRRPAASAPPGSPVVVDSLRRHLQALYAVNSQLTLDELRAHAENELAHVDASLRPAVDALDALLVEVVEGSDGDLERVPGDAPPV